MFEWNRVEMVVLSYSLNLILMVAVVVVAAADKTFQTDNSHLPCIVCIYLLTIQYTLNYIHKKFELHQIKSLINLQKFQLLIS